MNLMFDPQTIKDLTPEQCIDFLNEYLLSHPEDEEALTYRGMKHWILNQRQLAINDYLKALQINPDSKAKTALEYANSILNFYHKDLYNP